MLLWISSRLERREVDWLLDCKRRNFSLVLEVFLFDPRVRCRGVVLADLRVTSAGFEAACRRKVDADLPCYKSLTSARKDSGTESM
ncbi:hypothetical protein KC347_g29 [Hortaea werneckii]|nr:hypothetical protein KC347_g29 [Hortaea werneckii]